MGAPIITKSRRLRSTPFTRRVEQSGLSQYTAYNHMLLPTVFESPEADYWHLCEKVQVWDVSAERQVELRGPDAARLAQLMTPRDLSKLDLLQGKYAPICNAEGFILNDPIVIKLADDRFWLSVADSDVKLFAQGLAIGFQLDVHVFEPDVFPLAVQGPHAEELVARVFGEVVRDTRFFRGQMLTFLGADMYVARSGWSKQGGFEIYLNDARLAEPLWDALFDAGPDLEVRAGCPNSIERLESGLLSYGNDMDEFDTPLDCGLEAYINFDADIESLSLDALRAKRGHQVKHLVGLMFSEKPILNHANHRGGFDLFQDGAYVGELRSRAWSPRHQRHLAFAMLQTEFLDHHSSLYIGELESRIYPLPFNFNEL